MEAEAFAAAAILTVAALAPGIAGHYIAGMDRRFDRSHLHRVVGSRTLVVMLLVAGAVWAFLAVADEVDEGETSAFDSAIMMALRTGDTAQPIGGATVEEIARDVTALGGFTLVTAITVGVCVLFLLNDRVRSAAFVAAAVIGGAVFSSVFKDLYDRPRPDLVPHDVLVSSASFPSGHTMLATVVYLTLATMLARVTRRRRLKLYYFVVAGLVAVSVGVSRVYLGVHWPTDVIAGWAAGTAWALGVWLLARVLERRGTIEPEADEADPDSGGIDAPPDRPAQPDLRSRQGT